MRMLTALAAIAACMVSAAVLAKPPATRSEPFGKAPNGTPVEFYTHRNRNGIEARIGRYGDIVVSFTAPDRVMS